MLISVPMFYRAIGRVGYYFVQEQCVLRVRVSHIKCQPRPSVSGFITDDNVFRFVLSTVPLVRSADSNWLIGRALGN